MAEPVFSPADVQFIETHLAELGPAEVARRLGKKESQVRSKGHELGIRVPRRCRAVTGCSSVVEPSYTAEELELLKAIDQYKRQRQRPWPTWSEILAIVRALGYRKVAADEFQDFIKRAPGPALSPR